MSLKLPRETELQFECDYLRRTLDSERESLNRYKKRTRLFFCISTILAIFCISLVVFSIVHGNSKYETGYTDGYAIGVEDTKALYSKPNKSGGVTVYITSTGKKYHEKGCAYLSSSSIPISLKEAKAEGYTACSECSPPK